MSTKLKLLGVDVASFGDAFGSHAGRARRQPLRHQHRRLQEAGAVAPTASTCSAACWSATRAAYGELLQHRAEPDRAAARARDADRAGRRRRQAAPALGVDRPARRRADLLVQQRQQGRDLRRHPRAEADRGRRGQDVHQGRHRPAAACVPLVTELLKAELKRAGVAVSNHLCEHFPHSRQELYHLVRFHKHKTFDGAARAPRPGRAAARSASPPWRRSWRRPGTNTSSRRKHAAAAGHQRPLPGQHPARRHLLGRAARPGRRDHARPADRDRPHRQARTACTPRSPAASASTCSARASSSCPTSGASWSRPASSRGTPTARRCAP